MEKSDREALIDTLQNGAKEWLDTASKFSGALIGERMILVDKYERAITITDSVDLNIKFKIPARSLAGVSFMSAKEVESVRASLETSLPDFAPYAAYDFKDFAKKKAGEVQLLINQLRSTGNSQAHADENFGFSPS